MVEKTYDVIILGGGPAGLTAGIYTGRQGLKTLLIEGKQVGGKAWGPHRGKAWGPHRIENFPGFPNGITGEELMERFISQAKRFGAEFKMETVVGLSDMGERKIVLTRGGYYNAKAVIVSTGIQKKQLSIPGEMEYKGRGVCYCGICDGPFFADKVVAVVGSGKEAVEDALRLAELAEKVYSIPGVEGYDDEVEDLDKLMEHEKIRVIEGSEVKSIGGNGVVTHIELEHEATRLLKVDGVFIILENVATNEIIKDAGIEVDSGGCIKVDNKNRTNLAGVFAAGDCVCGGMQVVTAAGDGGKAALSAMRYIRSLK